MVLRIGAVVTVAEALHLDSLSYSVSDWIFFFFLSSSNKQYPVLSCVIYNCCSVWSRVLTAIRFLGAISPARVIVSSLTLPTTSIGSYHLSLLTPLNTGRFKYLRIVDKSNTVLDLLHEW